jgi:hypothetical protein
VLKKYLTIAQEAVEKLGYHDLKGMSEITSGLVRDRLNPMDKR